MIVHANALHLSKGVTNALMTKHGSYKLVDANTLHLPGGVTNALISMAVKLGSTNWWPTGFSPFWFANMVCWALENRMSIDDIPSLRRGTRRAWELPLHAGPLGSGHFKATTPERTQVITRCHNPTACIIVVHSACGPS